MLFSFQNIAKTKAMALHALFLLSLVFHATHVISQTSPSTLTCSSNSSSLCNTYVVYRAQAPDFIDIGHISDLFNVTPQSIAKASNLPYEELALYEGQLLLIPITCGCTGNRSFANTTHQMKHHESFYSVSITSFENLTDYHVVEDLNPTLDPTKLKDNVQVIFPLYCRCPSKTQLDSGLKFLLTYVWQARDDVTELSKTLNALPEEVLSVNDHPNFTAVVGLPILIPVKELPLLTQLSYMSPKSPSIRIRIIALSATGGLLVSMVFWALIFLCYRYRKTKKVGLPGFSLESINFLCFKEHVKDEVNFCPKTAKSKFLPRISDYLDKPVIYEMDSILEATMNLDERYRIAGSVYIANIDGETFAVKRTQGDVSEELKLLQRVNHANLVKLSGVSTDAHGDVFMVYEYAENRSLEQWLYPSSSSVSFLSWRQRLNIALDVANGLQYMHEHARPSIVHGDIRTTNVLLDAHFKAKISNFSMARLASDNVSPKGDVFAFGVVLLELLSGKKAMESRGGEIAMAWEEIQGILEDGEEREERLKGWMDQNLKGFYPMEGAMSLACMARACTWERSSERPSIGEVVFGLSVLAQQTCSVGCERSWMLGLEEKLQIVNPVIAR
ncbi:Protein LYK5 [Acorus gramineus]|uniref:non-specific serine/threonine protein kinase n=1 Tax=Acorus gramineus TaxID=55184 RepID=A0AAV9B010_ACOGR|nr:Protein LYK5 [Acorus gramineus]